MKELGYSLYILRCADGSLYTGIAIDVQKRLHEHRVSNRGAKFLRGRGPLQLEYTERLRDRSIATRAEQRVKRLNRAKKEALIAGRISLTDILLEDERRSRQASGEIGA